MKTTNAEDRAWARLLRDVRAGIWEKRDRPVAVPVKLHPIMGVPIKEEKR